MSDDSTCSNSIAASQLEPPIIHDEHKDQTNSMFAPKPKSGLIYQIIYPIPTPPTTVLDTQMYTRPPSTPVQIPIPDNPAAQTLPVSCGNVIGKMHLHLFLCPGIHQPCIEHGNELLTPKQFTVRADKAKQKDWKASIRIGKSSLRVHMEARTIDFHDHSNRCSGKCQSRNYVNSMNEVKIEEVQMRKAKRTAESSVLMHELNEITGLGDEENDESEVIQEQEEQDGKGDSETSKIMTEKKTRGRPKGSVNKTKTKLVSPNHRARNQNPRNSCRIEQMSEQVFNSLPVEDVLASTDIQHAQTPTGCTPYNEIFECLQNDPKHFWEQMHSTGVISHFCDDIIVSAINLKQSVLTMSEISQNTANILTRSAFAFGIQSMIVQRVQSIEKSVVQQQKHQEMLLDMMQSGENNNNYDMEIPMESEQVEIGIPETSFIENQETSNPIHIKHESTF